MSEDKEEKTGSLNKAMIAVADGVIGAGILVIIGVYGGHFIDEKLKTMPWFSILLPWIGGGLGLFRLVLKAINLDKDKSN